MDAIDDTDGFGGNNWTDGVYGMIISIAVGGDSEVGCNSAVGGDSVVLGVLLIVIPVGVADGSLVGVAVGSLGSAVGCLVGVGLASLIGVTVGNLDGVGCNDDMLFWSGDSGDLLALTLMLSTLILASLSERRIYWKPFSLLY